jgi:hypothetical protein
MSLKCKLTRSAALKITNALSLFLNRDVSESPGQVEYKSIPDHPSVQLKVILGCPNITLLPIHSYSPFILSTCLISTIYSREDGYPDTH